MALEEDAQCRQSQPYGTGNDPWSAIRVVKPRVDEFECLLNGAIPNRVVGEDVLDAADEFAQFVPRYRSVQKVPLDQAGNAASVMTAEHPQTSKKHAINID